MEPCHYTKGSYLFLHYTAKSEEKKYPQNLLFFACILGGCHCLRACAATGARPCRHRRSTAAAVVAGCCALKRVRERRERGKTGRRALPGGPGSPEMSKRVTVTLAAVAAAGGGLGATNAKPSAGNPPERFVLLTPNVDDCRHPVPRRSNDTLHSNLAASPCPWAAAALHGENGADEAGLAGLRDVEQEQVAARPSASRRLRTCLPSWSGCRPPPCRATSRWPASRACR